MHTAFLYTITVLIWGTSWLAIKYQLGDVAPLVSVAHRMALAAIFCAALTWLARGFVRIGPGDHLRIFAQALCLFSGNYLLIYAGTAQLSTGLVAVVFSTMVILNALGGALFTRAPLHGAVLAGGLVGIAGMVVLFYPEFTALGWSEAQQRALGLVFFGTVAASAGNLIAATNLRRGVPVLTCNSWGMAYGAIMLYAVALALRVPITVSTDSRYLLSLAYLAFVATVLAFWAYLSLLARIGADRAAYITLIFPVVALVVSTFFEDYRWTVWSVAGLSLVLAGNWQAMRGARNSSG